jgi:hypothetical protein
MEYAKQIDPDFHNIEPLNGSAQCIKNPSHIPTSKEGILLYYQDMVVADGM